MADTEGLRRLTNDIIARKRTRLKESVKEGRYVEGRLRYKNMISMKSLFEVKDVFKKVDGNFINVILPKNEDILEYDRLKNVFMSGEDYTMEFEVPISNVQVFGENEIGINHQDQFISSYSLYHKLLEQTSTEYLKYFEHRKGSIEPTWYEMSELPLMSEISSMTVMKYKFVLPLSKMMSETINLDNLEKEYNLILNTVKTVLHSIDGFIIRRPYTHVYSDGSEEEIIWSREGGSFGISNSRRIQRKPIELINLFKMYVNVYNRYMNWIKKTNIESIFDSKKRKPDTDAEILIGNFLSKDDIKRENSFLTDGLSGVESCKGASCTIMGGNKKTKRKKGRKGKKNKTKGKTKRKARKNK